MKIILRDTIESDLQFVLKAETNSENNPYVAQWSKSEHCKSFKNRDIRHLIIEDSKTGNSVGYIIMAGFQSQNKSIELKRIVVTKKGQGFGKEAIKLIKQLVFGKMKFHRLWLDVRDHNSKAKSLYEKCGFTEEGHIRDCVIVNNKYESIYLMSILENEY